MGRKGAPKVPKVTAGVLGLQIVNPHLLKDLTERGLWNEEMKNQIIAFSGSIQVRLADGPGPPALVRSAVRFSAPPQSCYMWGTAELIPSCVMETIHNCARKRSPYTSNLIQRCFLVELPFPYPGMLCSRQKMQTTVAQSWLFLSRLVSFLKSCVKSGVGVLKTSFGIKAHLSFVRVIF